MRPTEKLYEISSYIKEFDAEVLDCHESNGKYHIILDKTAFFPEGGGQRGDTGHIGNAVVSDTFEQDGIIIHVADKPIREGTVTCSIDWKIRFPKMQNHTGEHILSGIIYSLYGYNNVSFHMGEDYITLDTDGELSDDDIKRIEAIANQKVWDGHKVTITYPSAGELENINYRSKLDIKDNVRIVTIEDCDVCACCAPHVANTSEIGIIKIIDYMRYKGGMRLFAVCGAFAYKDYSSRVDDGKKLSSMLSLPVGEIYKGVEQLKNEMIRLKSDLTVVNGKIADMVIAGFTDTDKNICLFCNLDTNGMRKVVNEGMKKCKGICGIFSGDDQSGYKYIIGSETTDLRAMSKVLNSTLNGHGGGSARMIQGSVACSRTLIEDYFTELKLSDIKF